MASSKHFPVQKYLPQASSSDHLDYIVHGDTNTTQYNDNITASIDDTDNIANQSTKSNDATCTDEMTYHDSSIVSAYESACIYGWPRVKVPKCNALPRVKHGADKCFCNIQDHATEPYDNNVVSEHISKDSAPVALLNCPSEYMDNSLKLNISTELDVVKDHSQTNISCKQPDESLFTEAPLQSSRNDAENQNVCSISRHSSASKRQLPKVPTSKKLQSSNLHALTCLLQNEKFPNTSELCHKNHQTISPESTLSSYNEKKVGSDIKINESAIIKIKEAKMNVRKCELLETSSTGQFKPDVKYKDRNAKYKLTEVKDITEKSIPNSTNSFFLNKRIKKRSKEYNINFLNASKLKRWSSAEINDQLENLRILENTLDLKQQDSTVNMQMVDSSEINNCKPVCTIQTSQVPSQDMSNAMQVCNYFQNAHSELKSGWAHNVEMDSEIRDHCTSDSDMLTNFNEIITEKNEKQISYISAETEKIEEKSDCKNMTMAIAKAEKSNDTESDWNIASKHIQFPQYFHDHFESDEKENDKRVVIGIMQPQNDLITVIGRKIDKDCFEKNSPNLTDNPYLKDADRYKFEPEEDKTEETSIGNKQNLIQMDIKLTNVDCTTNKCSCDVYMSEVQKDDNTRNKAVNVEVQFTERSYYEQSFAENEEKNAFKLNDFKNSKSLINKTIDSLAANNLNIGTSTRNEEKAFDQETENHVQNNNQQQVKVERTQSYRKKVMARAKRRYNKSTMVKECSCTQNQVGDIVICHFCENYDQKRSKSSMENMTLSKLGEFNSDSKCNDKLSSCSSTSSLTYASTPGLSALPTSTSPHAVRKVQVTSRVSLLLKSDLFKKHLYKNEKFQKDMMLRSSGMHKSVSNIYLSEHHRTDSAVSISETEQLSNIINNKIDKMVEDPCDISQDLSLIKQKNRRHTLMGTSYKALDSQLSNTENAFRTLPKSTGRSRLPIPNFKENTSDLFLPKTIIPSFHDFRKLKDRSYLAECIVPNSQNLDVMNVGAVDKENKVTNDSSSVYKQSIADAHGKVLTLSVQTNQEDSLNQENILKDTVVTADDGDSELIEGADSLNVPEQQDKTTAESVLSTVHKQYTVNHGLSNAHLEQLPCDQSASIFLHPKLHQRTKSKLRFHAFSQSDLNVEEQSLSDISEGVHSLVTERQKAASKRSQPPLSKMSSISASLQESENKGSNLEHIENSIENKRIVNVNSSFKPKYKSNTDNDCHNRMNRDAVKGHSNVVTFDLEEYRQCSPFDTPGESEILISVTESCSDSFQSKSPVLRSTSDACEITQEAARKRRGQRKERPYKSDPFSGTEIIPASKRCVLRAEKEKLHQPVGFSSFYKESIFSYFKEVKHSDITPGESLEELHEDDEQQSSNETSRKLLEHHRSNVSSLSADSGVIGQDSAQSSPCSTLSHSHSEQVISSSLSHLTSLPISASCDNISEHQFMECQDCITQNVDNLHQVDINICQKCHQKCIERREIVQEIIDTEVNYGRDLNILKEEFYKPIMSAGLLTTEQLDAIFLNLDELLHVHKQFIIKLKSALNTAIEKKDMHLQSVQIGSIFLHSSTMFLSFEHYCVNQAQVSILLGKFEEEKELLQIFLQVSQNENQKLRRMHLKSFLMVPVQRIMKYPLLLNRLYRVTSKSHADKDQLKEAKDKIEDILVHINAKSQICTSIRQRKSSQRSMSISISEKMEISHIALDIIGWNQKDVCTVIMSPLQVAQPVDHTWALKKCKNYKFMNVFGVLLTLLFPDSDNKKDSCNINSSKSLNSNNNENNNLQVKSAAVVFLKEKNGHFQVFREPFMLEKVVVSQDPDYLDVFEILEWNKEAYLIKSDSVSVTKLWLQNLRQQMDNLGAWRKRRNALPNILLNNFL